MLVRVPFSVAWVSLKYWTMGQYANEKEMCFHFGMTESINIHLT